MAPEIAEPVLLTGAGFTHNFGGYLASTMWAHIFNSPAIQSRPGLAALLRQDLDYESAYREILYGNYAAEEKTAFTQAVAAVYEQLDSVLCNILGPPARGFPDIYQLSRFINRFAGQGNLRGYFFTLNQDLFVERWYQGEQIPITPGVPNLRVAPQAMRALTGDDLRTLPDADETGRARQEDEAPVGESGCFHYVKLHGSSNWRTHDGRNAMVIGGRKPEQIAGEPILEWYFDLFRQVLALPGRRLLVIGYGFGDEHLNQVLGEAVERLALKWYVLAPEDPRQFVDKVHRGGAGERIWDGLAGYFPYTLSDLFPVGEGRETEPARQVRRAIFG